MNENLETLKPSRRDQTQLHIHCRHYPDSSDTGTDQINNFAISAPCRTIVGSWADVHSWKKNKAAEPKAMQHHPISKLTRNWTVTDF